MTPPDGKRSPLELQQRMQRTLADEWEQAHAWLNAFEHAGPDAQPQHLGVLREQLTPWLDRAIHVVELRFFVLAPREAVRARLFAHLAAGLSTPATWDGVQVWLERAVLDALGEPEPAACSAAGGAGVPAGLQRRFNGLPFQERALLYLYSVAGAGLGEVAEEFGLAPPEAAAQLDRLWRRVVVPAGAAAVPPGWQAPPVGGAPQEAAPPGAAPPGDRPSA